MPEIQSIGGRSFVIPFVAPDISSAELAVRNWKELNDSFLLAGTNNGTVQLPAGSIYATFNGTAAGKSIFNLDDRMAGITIAGAGQAKTLLIDPLSSTAPIAISSRAITNFSDGTFENGRDLVTLIFDISQYSEDDVLYFWVGASGLRPYRQRLRVLSVDQINKSIVLDGNISESPPVSRFEHAKGVELEGPAEANATSVKLVNSAHSTRFHVGDVVAITDGPAFDEPYSEFMRVTHVDSSSGLIHFFPPLRRTYFEDMACLVPPPHMTDITIRDLSVAASINSGSRYMGYVRMGLRLAFENFAVVPAPEDPTPGLVDLAQLNFANAQELRWKNCTFALPTFNVCQDVLVTGCRSRGLTGEELTNDVQFIGSTFDGPTGFRFDTANSPGGACKRIHLTACRILNYASPNGVVAFNEDSSITDVEIVPAPGNTNPIYLNDGLLRMTNVVSGAALRFRGSNLRLTNLTAPQVLLESDGALVSSGVFLMPLLPDPNQLFNSTPAGNWLVPMLAQTDGRTFASGIADFPAGLTVNEFGGTHPLRFYQTYDAGGISAAALKPVGTDTMKCFFELFPSGDGLDSNGTGALIQFLNHPTKTSAGHLQIGVDGAEGFVTAFNSGATTSVTSFRISLPTIVTALNMQSAPLQQWQAFGGSPLFAILSDGQMASANVENGDIGSRTRRLPLHDPTSGNLIGYIAVHDEP